MVKPLSLGLGILLLVGGLYFFTRDDNQTRMNTTTQATPDLTIIAFGDSLTAGYGLPAGESYPAQLETALKAEGKQVEVINAGVSGETTRGNLERAAFIRAQNPDIVLLGIGGNDALRVLPVSETRANITRTIETLKEGDNPPAIILLSMQSPLNSGLRYKQEFDAVYAEIAQAQSITLVPFLTTEVFLNQDNKLQDGIHLNKIGYGIVVKKYLLEPVVEAIENIEK
jgi:acyl-CoA thioesterase I